MHLNTKQRLQRLQQPLESSTADHFVIPVLPMGVTLGVLALLYIEIIIYGVILAVPFVWFPLAFGAFYLTYSSLFRKDALPSVFTVLFLTAHHSLVYYYNRDIPIAGLFMLIFGVNTGIMWVLLHYATHLKREYHWAYSLISGFMIAQIITLYASMAREWPFRFELAAYFPTVFSYVFWRFACLSAESMLGWKQFIRVAVLVFLLIIAMVIGSPNVQV